MLRICFVGLGSIGKRHIKNVVHLLNQRKQDYEIDAVRSTDKPISPEINSLVDHLYYNVEELQGEYDIIFITNPTVCHYDTIKRFGRYTKHMFIEKPVFHEYVEDIDQLNLNSDGIYYVACPLRYSAVLQDLKGRLRDEKVYSVRAISSSYLPDWRTGVDYRHVYSAHKNMGGGVTLDLIHELDYVVWLFGIPDWSYHLCGKFSELEIDSDDLSVYLLKYPDKAVEIHTDYFGRESVRKIEIYCRDYVMEADLIHNTLKYMYGKGNTESVNMTENDVYLQEMKAFFDMIEGQRNNDNDIIYANEILKIALAD